MNNKKLFSLFAFAVSLSLIGTAAACTNSGSAQNAPGAEPAVSAPAQNAPEAAEKEAAPEVALASVKAESLCGTYSRSDNSQTRFSSLVFKPWKNNGVLFRIKSSEGNENGGITKIFVHSGLIFVENGKASYTLPEGGILNFEFSADGKSVKLTHSGNCETGFCWEFKMRGKTSHSKDCAYSADGTYNFDYSDFDLDSAICRTALEELPSAATSLTSANRGYEIHFSDNEMGGCCYNASVYLGRKMIAQFLLESQLKCIYRADPDTDAVLIYGQSTPEMEKFIRSLGKGI